VSHTRVAAATAGAGVHEDDCERYYAEEALRAHNQQRRKAAKRITHPGISTKKTRALGPSLPLVEVLLLQRDLHSLDKHGHDDAHDAESLLTVASIGRRVQNRHNADDCCA